MKQNQLKRARDALGMKQWELGIALGVSEAEVCLWEKGKRTMPERYLRFSVFVGQMAARHNPAGLITV